MVLDLRLKIKRLSGDSLFLYIPVLRQFLRAINNGKNGVLRNFG